MMYFTTLLERIAVRTKRAHQQQQSQRKQNQTQRRSTVLGRAVEPLEHRTLLSTVSIGNATATEGAPLTFTVSLNAAATAPVTVRYAVQNGTGRVGTDYARTPAGALVFAAGETTKTVTVNTVDNNIFAADKTLRVRLLAPSRGNNLGTAIGTGTIINNDAAPVVSITPAVVDKSEGNRGLNRYTFNVSVDKLAEQPIRVTVATADVSTTSTGRNADYVALRPRTIVFSGSKRSIPVVVSVRGDTTAEANEVFRVNVTGATNATVPANTFGMGVIRNDDGTTLPSGTTVAVSATAPVTAAAGTTVGIPLQLSQLNADPVVVNYTITPGTAVAGTDFVQPTTAQVTIPAGQTTALLPIQIPGTATDGRTFTVTLNGTTDPIAGTVSTTQTTATVNIAAASTLPNLSVANVSVVEGNAGTKAAAFTVTLSQASTLPITVGYTLADGTAVAGQDYTAAATGTLTFAPGETSKTIPVTILGDTTVETDETLTLTLGAPVNAPITTGTATMTITNDDSTTGGTGNTITGTGITQNGSTGFGGMSDGQGHPLGYSFFNYSYTSTRSTALNGAKIEFFHVPKDTDLNTVTPYKVFDLGTIPAGQTVSGQTDASGYTEVAGNAQYARLVTADGLVYAINFGTPLR
jgi:chitinase